MMPFRFTGLGAGDSSLFLPPLPLPPSSDFLELEKRREE